MAIYTSILTGGTNSHPTTSEEGNALATDFFSAGIVGDVDNTGGVSPSTGGFAVNAQGTPAMAVDVSSGVAYVTTTPTSQGSQLLRVKATTTTTVSISANSTGGTRYDWIYLKTDASKAANPAVGGDDVATVVASRSTLNTADDGTPPSYGIVLAIVTVSNGAISITDANITDKRATSTIVTTSSGGTAPTGSILDYAGTTEPAGWLFCYGQTVSRTTYSDLFAVLGTTYGAGNGATTFGLPDLRGRVVAGQDDMGGTSANRLTGVSGGINGDTLGGVGGLETHTLTTAQLASHTHAVDPPATATDSQGSHSHTIEGGANWGSSGGWGISEDSTASSNGQLNTDASGAHTHTVNIASFTSGAGGSGSAHNNVQPTIILNKIIKY